MLHPANPKNIWQAIDNIKKYFSLAEPLPTLCCTRTAISKRIVSSIRICFLDAFSA
jgi:hypothetical protein